MEKLLSTVQGFSDEDIANEAPRARTKHMRG
jgi:hypothetical protein